MAPPTGMRRVVAPPPVVHPWLGGKHGCAYVCAVRSAHTSDGGTGGVADDAAAPPPPPQSPPSDARTAGSFYMEAADLKNVMVDMDVSQDAIEQVLQVNGGWAAWNAADFHGSALSYALLDLPEVHSACFLKVRDTKTSRQNNALWKRHDPPAHTSIFTRDLKTAVAKYPALEKVVYDLPHVAHADGKRAYDSGVARIIFANADVLYDFKCRDIAAKTNDRNLDVSHVEKWDRIWNGATPPSSVVIVVHGASGTGKTLCAMLAASSDGKQQDDRLNRVCLIVQPAALELAPGQTTATYAGALETLTLPKFIDAFTEQRTPDTIRDDLFVAAFERHLEGLVGGNGDVTAGTAAGTVIVVFDEMGNHPWAVRAIIGARGRLEEAAKRAFGAATVRIAVVGTGVAGAVLQPGSQPSAYCIAQPTLPAAWDSNMLKWKTHIDNPRSTAAKRCLEAVRGNSRFATLFINAVHGFRHGPDLIEQPHVIEACMTVAAHDYKSMNRLSCLNNAGLHRAVVGAVAATRLPALGAKDYRTLSGSLGLLEDRARLNHDSRELELDPTSFGQRFSVPAATWIIVRACLNDVERPTTGEGLELSIADWLRWTALVEARSVGLAERANLGPQPAWAGGKAPELCDDDKTPLKPRLSEGWTRAWKHPGKADPARPDTTPLTVHTLKLTHKVEPECAKKTVAELKKTLEGKVAPDGGKAHHRVIAVNADQSAFADIIDVDYHRKRLTLWQSKRLSHAFPANDLETELGKMGYGPCAEALYWGELMTKFTGQRKKLGDAGFAAAVAKEVQTNTAAPNKTLAKDITKAISEDKRGHWAAVRGVLAKHNISLCKATGAADKEHTDREPAKFAEYLAGELLGTGSRARFAVLVHSAVPPAAVPASVRDTGVKAGDVICIHSVPREAAAARAGGGVGGAGEWSVFEELYPVRVAESMRIDSKRVLVAETAATAAA